MLSVMVLGLVLVPVASANAAPSGLRDPFDPVLTVDTTDGTTTDGTPTTDDGATDPTTTTDPAPAPDDDGLPTTGGDTKSWLAMAYVLVALGSGVLAAARFARPATRKLVA